MRHAMAVADMPLAAAILADSMHTILEFTDAQEARAVARAWLAKFGDAAAEANPGQLLEFVLPLASAGHREAEGWLTKVNQAHPSPATGPGRPGARHLDGLLQQPGQRRSCAGAQQAGPPGGRRRGRAGSAVPDARAADPAGSRSAPAGRRPPGCGRRPPPRPRTLVGSHRGRVPVTRHCGLGGIPAGRPGLSRRGAGPGWGAAAEYDAVAHGVGQIFANMTQAGIHLERREHEPAATLLAAARDGGTDQRPPVHPGHGRHLDRPAGHGSGGPGGRAGVLGPGAPGPRRARRQGPGTVRARGVPRRARPGASRSGRADPAAAGEHRLPAAPGPAARPAAGVGEGRADLGGNRASSLSASGWNGGSSGAWRHRRPTSRGRTATCGRPWNWPSPTGTWPPSSSRDPASPPCSVPCRPAPVSSPTSMSCRYAQRRPRPHPRARPDRCPAGS